MTALTPGLYIHSATASEAQRRLLDAVREHHDESPQSPGIGRSQLRKVADLPKVAFDPLIAQLLERGELCKAGDRFALPGHAVTFDQEERECLDTVESLFREAGFKPPGPSDAVEQIGRPGKRVEWALATLIENGQLVEVAEGLVFHRDAVERAKRALVLCIQSEGKLESVKFKYLLDTTRKYAIPLLDYFDRIGVTRRVGHTRYLKGAPEANPER
ncbi:MAG: SelB domain-containing protein [Planctomycetota bacterium]